MGLSVAAYCFHANRTNALSEKTSIANRTIPVCDSAVNFHKMKIAYSESAQKTTLDACLNSVREKSANGTLAFSADDFTFYAVANAAFTSISTACIKID